VDRRSFLRLGGVAATGLAATGLTGIDLTRKGTFSSDELLAWARNPGLSVRLRTAEAVLPGGWSAAMSPGMVDWKNSKLTGEDSFYALRNLNLGGNPIEGTTVLQPVRVPADGVREAEYIVVPLDSFGMHGVVAHAMIRFLFAPGREPTLPAGAGSEAGGDARVRDLILSWEAWRPPGVDFDVMNGLDPHTFGLTLRVYTGGQRFLEDTLQTRDWHAYSLQLSGGRNGLNELLRIALVLGDGVARRSMDHILGAAEADAYRTAVPSGRSPAEDLARWLALREELTVSRAPDQPLVDLRDTPTSYETLLRSCSTMALHSIGLAEARMVGDKSGGRNLEALNLASQKLEPWMIEMAHTDLPGLFLRAPFALWWLVRHQSAIPTRGPAALEKAGLLRRDAEGKPVSRHYTLPEAGPYGDIRRNLLR